MQRPVAGCALLRRSKPTVPASAAAPDAPGRADDLVAEAWAGWISGMARRQPITPRPGGAASEPTPERQTSARPMQQDRAIKRNAAEEGLRRVRMIAAIR